MSSEALKNKFKSGDKGIYVFAHRKMYMLDVGDQRVMNPPGRLVSIMTARGVINDDHSARTPQFKVMKFGDAIQDGKEIEVLYLTKNIQVRAEAKAEQGYVDPWG